MRRLDAGSLVGIPRGAALIVDMTTGTHRKLSRPTKEQLDELMAWRAEALERMPYFARILYAFRPLDAPGLGTFACDPSYRLYIDFEAVSQRGVRWCAEAMLHECGHIYNDHAGRSTEHRVLPNERFLWNLSADAEINDDLVATGCQTIAENGVLPCHFQMDDHLLAEQYMDALRQQRPPSLHASEGGSQGEPGDGASDSDDDADGQPFGGCGSGSGGEAAPCELAPDDDANGAAPGVSEAEKKVIQIATAAAVREHAAKHPGTTPGGLVERAEMILAPSKLPWRQILASSLRRAAAMRVGVHDTTYLRPNRRRSRVEVVPGRRAVYPGSYAPEPQIVVVRDTSGSMSTNELSMVTSEVEAISRQMGVRDEALRVLDVDTEVAAVRGYQSATSLGEVVGRGGTNMGAGIAYAVNMRPRPTVIVVLTDGYTPWPAEKPRVPVVVCIVGQGDLSYLLEAAPKWASVVAVDLDEDVRSESAS